MAYDAFVVDGTQVKVTISSVKTAIPGVQTASFSGMSKPQIEYTAISDTTAKFKTGRADWGSLSFEVAWDPSDTVHQYLLAQANSTGVTDHFDITLPTTTAYYMHFDGSIQSIDFGLDKQSVGKATITVKVSGAVTVTTTP